jgi:hypothetical protein
MSSAIPRAQVESNLPFQGQELDFCEPGVTEEGGINGRNGGNYFWSWVVLEWAKSTYINIYIVNRSKKKR